MTEAKKLCIKCELREVMMDYVRQKPGVYCHKCQDEIYREEYKRNRPGRLVKLRNKSKENKAFIRELKTNAGCMDCGECYPFYVMEFHHLNPQFKTKSISQMMGYTRETLLKEISKCVLLCSNCHRIRSYSEGYDDSVD
jgi:hypothetical protein